jgi:molybdate transport system substrate-binding protein
MTGTVSTSARVLLAFAVSVGLCVGQTRAATQAGGDVLVFAASSLQTALDDLAAPVRNATGVRMRMSYAASSALARQIESGAPAGLFISADLDWMNYLADRKLVRAESRVNLLGNRLVLIATKGHQPSLKIGPEFGLALALGRERLALADPAVVPAGKYAREALTKLGVWDDVANKIAAAENVRGALLLVARGEAPLGIVYRTDALVEPGVVVVDTFPESSHAPIIYPAALTMPGSEAAAKVLEYLKTPAARAVFDRHGFTASGRN